MLLIERHVSAYSEAIIRFNNFQLYDGIVCTYTQVNRHTGHLQDKILTWRPLHGPRTPLHTWPRHPRGHHSKHT